MCIQFTHIMSVFFLFLVVAKQWKPKETIQFPA